MAGEDRKLKRDIRLPRMNGIEALRHLRADPRARAMR
jgi:CheY-like chemotaxis protein